MLFHNTSSSLCVIRIKKLIHGVPLAFQKRKQHSPLTFSISVYHEEYALSRKTRHRCKHGRGASVKDAPRPYFISLYRFYSVQTPTETRSMMAAA